MTYTSSMWNCTKIEHKQNYPSLNGYGAFLETFSDSVTIAIPWENYTQDHRTKDTLSIYCISGNRESDIYVGVLGLPGLSLYLAIS